MDTITEYRLPTARQHLAKLQFIQAQMLSQLPYNIAYPMLLARLVRSAEREASNFDNQESRIASIFGKANLGQ